MFSNEELSVIHKNHSYWLRSQELPIDDGLISDSSLRTLLLDDDCAAIALSMDGDCAAITSILSFNGDEELAKTQALEEAVAEEPAAEEPVKNRRTYVIYIYLYWFLISICLCCRKLREENHSWCVRRSIPRNDVILFRIPWSWENSLGRDLQPRRWMRKRNFPTTKWIFLFTLFQSGNK